MKMPLSGADTDIVTEEAEWSATFAVRVQIISFEDSPQMLAPALLLRETVREEATELGEATETLKLRGFTLFAEVVVGSAQ
jgi:hypothetical protein